MKADAATENAGSQTLSRGIRILEFLSEAREPLSIDQTAQHLGVHRSIAYRLVRTLEDHGLVTRDVGGRIQLGARMAALAAGVAHDLQAEALPELTAVANELGMTCFLVVLDHQECVTLASVEPRHAVAPLAQRPGTRHPVTVGAPGKAILSTLDRAQWPDDVSEDLVATLTIARERGYATSRDEVIPSLRSVAAPVAVPGRQPAAIAVVYVASNHDDALIAERLQRSASVIRDALGS